MNAFKLPNTPVRMPEKLLEAINDWDKAKLKKELSSEWVNLPVYIEDSFSYPNPLHYFIYTTHGFDDLYWKNNGEGYDPRPLIDIFLEKGVWLDWNESAKPDKMENFNRYFGLGKQDRNIEQLFSIMYRSLNTHLAEILVPYFEKAGAQFHISNEKKPDEILEHFLNGVFFNQNVLRFKRLVTPESLNILTILNNQGCLNKDLMEQEAKLDSVIAEYWQCWQDLQFQKHLEKTLSPSLNEVKALKKGFI